MEKSKNSTLEIYGDLLSQPVRALVAFCKMNKIPFEFKFINLSKGEHLTEEYEKINQYKKIPAIIVKTENQEFKLAESCAILRFLSDFYQVEEKWYPRQDIFRRGLVDQWLDWHHLNTRFAAKNFAFGKVFKPIFESRGLKTFTYDTEKLLLKILSFLNTLFEERKYIVDNNISIADLIITCELNQLLLAQFDFSKYPFLKEYLDRMNYIKEVEEVNQNLLNLKKKLENRKSTAKF